MGWGLNSTTANPSKNAYHTDPSLSRDFFKNPYGDLFSRTVVYAKALFKTLISCFLFQKILGKRFSVFVIDIIGIIYYTILFLPIRFGQMLSLRSFSSILFVEVIQMICTTIRNGVDCPFMTKNGCGYNGGVCYQVVEQCDGCGRRQEYESGWFCSSCPEPAAKWKNGSCNLATHVTTQVAASKTKINPLKASKRAAKK